MRFLSNSLEDTKAFAKELAGKIHLGDVVTLKGDLGAGKTTFVKFFAECLGVLDTITSPTFTILNEYQGKTKIYHFDMYRLETLDEALMTGALDVLNHKDGIYLIEWPQVVESILPNKRIDITIKNNKNAREFLVEGL